MVRNAESTAAAAALAFTVAGCARGPRVSGPADCAGTLAGTTAVVNTGTAPAAQLTASVRGESCGPVQASNRLRAANPLLPRYSAVLGQPGPVTGSGSMVLSGGTAYATAVVQQTSTNANGSAYGYGIWFKAAPGQGGTLFGFDASPTNAATAGQDDRQLTLGTDGRLTFTSLQGLGLLQPGPATSTATFADNQWHFAYATMRTGAAGLTLTNTLYVDGVERASTSALSAVLLPYITTTGYWHVGWGPLTPGYFTGSISNFVVFAAGNAPAVPATNPATQTAMDTFAATASEHWRLDDTGATTFSGTHPVIGSASPCSSAALTWTFGGATAVNGVLASTFATGATSYAVPAVPAPNASQASVLSTARATGASTYVYGLRLLVPATYTVRATAAWSLGFRFAGAASVLVLP